MQPGQRVVWARVLRTPYPHCSVKIYENSSPYNFASFTDFRFRNRESRYGLGWLSFIAQRFNWTDGCIAVSNSDMDEIWQAVNVGTPIEITP